jgi:hypothetical protein
VQLKVQVSARRLFFSPMVASLVVQPVSVLDTFLLKLSMVDQSHFKDGDRIRIDIVNRTLDLLVDPAELEARKVGWKPIPHKFTRGVLAKFSKGVSSASEGAVWK